MNYMHVKKIVSKVKLKLENYKNYLLYNTLRCDKKKYKILLAGTPAYGNLGDQLIAFAEKKFLVDLYGEEEVLEVSENDIRFSINRIEKMVDASTIIFMQGGGNVSDIWTDQENIRKKIITHFSNNKIVLLPQTAYIVDFARIEMILSKYSISSVVCAREKNSYSIFIKYLPQTYLCPDMALYLWDYFQNFRDTHDREGIGICMRKDIEALYCDYEELLIKNLGAYYECRTFTTVLDDYVYINESNRELEITAIIEYISGKQLIITDRLHAMIMAYLTGTPCIAFTNANKKVEGTFEWINNAENIHLAADLEDALGVVKNLIGKENNRDFKYAAKYKGIINFVS